MHTCTAAPFLLQGMSSGVLFTAALLLLCLSPAKANWRPATENWRQQGQAQLEGDDCDSIIKNDALAQETAEETA